MTMHCDNQVATYIGANPVFHERTKYIEVDCHITQEKVEDDVIATPYVSTRVQIADMFTKILCKTHLDLLCKKLELYDIYSPRFKARGTIIIPLYSLYTQIIFYVLGLI